ncbi:family 78 glycoside hydrolase catalytic domain [Kribbella antibiotica]|uniref:family 78 glycoside hydrolase catalytic domain n=1 Tax=Kribbella antibiotica TaxID=190195 RepID=UPI001EDCF336|nr:family 78 glycoside hydrolase catalytic domain [Kribbella antibiotica]
MRTLILLASALLLTSTPLTAAAGPTADPQVTSLRTNNLSEPLAIASGTPRLSWQLSAARRGLSQQRYEVHVASTADKLQTPDVWNSGQVTSSQSVDVPYGGPALARYSAYHWTVRIWDETGTASAWSPAAKFETGALQPSDWAGDWVGADDAVGPEWTDYTIDTDVSVQRDALGVYFRGRYMWQLNTTEGRMRLRPHVRQADGSYVVLADVDVAADLRPRNNLRITVSGQTITTWINGQQVDQRNRSDVNAAGLMGFRVHGDEEGLVQRLKVTNAAGTVLIDSAFPTYDQTFPVGYVRAAGGLLVKRASGTDLELWPTNPANPLFRKDISLPAGKTVVRARLHAAAQGIYEMRINGVKAGDHELAPGWTDYRQRIQTQTYDVTSLVRTGAANTIGAELASGWFSGHVGMFSPNRYGTRTALTAQLRVTYSDGSTDVFGTDSSWRTSTGAVRAGSLLHGETYDARAAQAGWDRPAYPAVGWQPVQVRPSATALLVPQTDQPVRVTQQLTATAIASNVPGTFLYDLGQNMVGVPQITLTGTPGLTVRLRFAEVLDKDGNFYTANLRSARATDYYTFASSSPETYRPRFTFHGFRYVEIAGLPAAPPASALKGLVLGADAERTSQLTTSSPLVNKLQSNITWGQRGNFLSIPTDTPARDERLGWTGDINVFARTAVYNQDSQAFLSKWLRDLRLEQRTNGAYPSIVPTVPEQFDGGNNNSGWADAGVNLPWTLWQAYGDTGIISEQFDSMKRYVDSLATGASGFIRPGGDYNDWLSLESSASDTNLIGTAFYAKSARQLSQMATAIGRTADADRYQRLYSDIRNAFMTRFVAADGRVSKGNQTDYILAITNDLIPADKVEAAGNHFANNVASAGHLKTGFLGVDGLLPALTKVGRTDLAYMLLQRTEYPSWGYEIGKGATTIWERWNSINPDGTFNDVGMNSFNHYAYGAVGQWMYGTMAGVSAAEPGYRKAVIAPAPGPGINFADFKYRTPYGEIASRWDRVGTDGLKLAVTVPGNTTAVVRIPASDPSLITEGGGALASAPYVSNIVDEGDTVAVTVAAGNYVFAVRGVEGATDYVDLGAAASESAHGLTAAPSSGTGTEAGRTRRYSGLQVPGSWFEFDLRIQAGQPFVMRLVETFDQAQVKDYEVRINGVLVNHRVNNRSKGGLDTYQFLVDNPALLTNPTIRVRIQHNAAASGYDPSLSDVWALPRT